MLTALRVVALVLILFGGCVVMVYGAAAQRILRHAGVRYRGWDRGADSLFRFCVFAGQESRPWRGRVLRDTRRSLLTGLAAGSAGMVLLAISALIEILRQCRLRRRLDAVRRRADVSAPASNDAH
ncbi:hypothetical protein [Longimicrobium sp.]|uniref:hypothetical protein n=1 Tax=Longimicrobium sp. TaxID=2029185 RepID=UPI003B3B929D